MNEYYVPGFTGYLQRSVLGDVGTPESLPTTVDPLTGQPVYTTSTAQPVVAGPAPAAYSLPTAQPVMAEPVPTAYGLPTEQPVVAEPAPAETAPVDLGGWNLADFQKQFMQGPTTDPLSEYLASQTAQGRDVAAFNPYQAGGLDAINYNIYNKYNPFDPNNPGASVGEVFRFDTGSKIGTPDGSGGFTYRNAAPLVFKEGNNYVLTDAAGKNVLGRASTPEELRKLTEMSSDLVYGWNLYQGDPEGKYTLGTEMFGRPDPRASGLIGALVNIGLPIALSMVPGLGWAGSAALTGAGTTLGGLALGGKTFSDALKSGALAAATTGLIKGTGLDKALGGGASGASNKLPSIADALADVNAQLAGTSFLAAPNAAAGAAAGLGGGLGGALEAPITVLGSKGLSTLGSKLLGAGTLAGGLAAANAAGLGTTNYGDQLWSEQAAAPGGEIVVNAPTISPPPPTPPLSLGDILTLPATAAPLTAIPNTNVPMQEMPPEVPVEPEIVVEGAPRPPLPLEDILTLPAATVPITSVTPPSIPLTEPPPPAEKGAIAKGLDIVDYLRLAGLGIGAIGSLFEGGGGSSSNFRVPGGMGSLHPSFSAKLPTANIPGLTGGTAAAPRTAANLGTQGLRTPQDYYRYGYGPEQSFFNYVPEAEKNTSTAYTGYAEGGFAVEGPGDGRDDKIPAMLSDGEYVIDAETVALLGNGSNRAGADMLDQFRVNVRKHKGRELTRGQFSKNAKKPEQYLAGGRA